MMNGPTSCKEDYEKGRSLLQGGLMIKGPTCCREDS